MVSARSVWAIHASACSIGLQVGELESYFPDIDPHNKDGLVPLDQQINFVRHLLAHPNEAIGLEIGINLPVDGLGLWGFLLRSSLTFGDMLLRAERYIRIVNKYPEFLLETRGNRLAQICAHPDPSPFGPGEQVVQCFLSHWLAWGRLLCKRAIRPLQANFTWSGPQDMEPFVEFYNCPLNFNSSEDSLLFDKDTLQVQLVDSTPQLAREFEKYAAALIEHMTAGDELLPRVRAAIEEGLASGQGRESDVAERLAMTTRTLHRKLKDRNTSFRQLREGVLQQKAKDLLCQSTIPLAEISFLLGYAETSTFYRAFKRWTGTVPGSWREQNSFGC